MRDSLLALAISLSALAASCTSTASRTHDLSAEDRAALRSFAQRDASIVLARDWDALASEYTSDAVRMPPNEPAVQGRVEIRRWLDQLPPIRNFTFELLDLQGNGDVAFMRGRWSIIVTPPNASSISDAGKILVVFRKQADGSWLRVADAWNSDGKPK